MSVEPQALERSVLEAKERDELATIAEALGLKPSARTSKAGLVDAILQGIGVEEPKPKKTRTRKKAANETGDGDAPKAEKTAVEAPSTAEGTGTDVPDGTAVPTAPPTEVGAAAAEAPAREEPAEGTAAAAEASCDRARQRPQDQPRDRGGDQGRRDQQQTRNRDNRDRQQGGGG